MPEPTKSENTPAPKGGEGLVPAKDIDLTQYVPKEEFTKVSEQAKATSDAVEKLKADLDKANLSLLDPDYMEYKEGKSKGAALPATADGNLETMNNTQLAEFIISKTAGEVKPLKSTMSDVLAVLELAEVEKRYTDFNDYRDQVKSIIGSSQAPLSFEQAYLIAKGNKPPETSPAKPGEPGTEKPGAGAIPAGEQQKDYDDKDAAGEDAWNKAVGPGKDRL